MKKQTIKTEKTQYSEDCPICKKQIKGYSESQVLYNMQVHLDRTHQLNQRDRQKILTGIKKELENKE